ncbi:dTMP kinase [Sulfurisphaera ohwakuensis]|uniref:Probable thymidylate kinase n=1 Tax=Sulfurisphaera ohwakuensis TaxID=69656 RepID=A0A650CEZ3_SULOH|nr:dTMP kinase [Sulfurisphaera ohwakuensis]MBB5252954.1 dTMP kinase [Sulfurisphaera ohwakuensis]QGR16117.1 dTMP kinase [Sulfurisphaera ohwakuensis]
MPRIISFEGIDGAGKTTLAKNVYGVLKKKGYNVILTQEPFTREITELIKKSGWNDPVLLTLLFSADRAFHIKWIMEQKPEIVLMDRYFHSTIAYQSVLGLDEKWIEEVNSKFPKPDIVFLLDIEVNEAIKRIRKDDQFNFEEKINTLEAVRKKYLELARKYNFIVLDAKSKIEELTEKTVQIICSLVKCS